MKVLYMLGCETVRTVCIDNGFYNSGSNEEYEKMFSMVTRNGGTMSVEEVAEIAENIAAHTRNDYGLTVEYITERLLNAAYILVK